MTRNIVVVGSVLALLYSATAVYGVHIETVPVGNPGNPGDVQSQGTFGSVPYYFRIGKYEVTNAQYVEFLNGVDPTGANTLELYNILMTYDGVGGINFNSGAANGSKYSVKSGRDNNPVVNVSWYDAIRFANWLHNGQGSGDTENGAYTLLGGTPTPSNGRSITRNAGAKWWLPSEDEWYKAAYHKQAQHRETVEQLYQAIHQLPKTDAALVLLYLDELSYREMAEVLGISESNVGVKLNRAKKALSELMKGDSHGP